MTDSAVSGGLMPHQKDEHDIWICKDCGWKYPNAKPSAKVRKNHKKHCSGHGGAAAPAAGGSSDDASDHDDEHHPSRNTEHHETEHVIPPVESKARSFDFAASAVDKGVSSGLPKPLAATNGSAKESSHEETPAIVEKHEEKASVQLESPSSPAAAAIAAGGLMRHQKDEHDIWVCKACGWKYPNARPSPKIRKNHKKQCSGHADAAAPAAAGSSDDASDDDHHSPLKSGNLTTAPVMTTVESKPRSFEFTPSAMEKDLSEDVSSKHVEGVLKETPVIADKHEEETLTEPEPKKAPYPATISSEHVRGVLEEAPVTPDKHKEETLTEPAISSEHVRGVLEETPVTPDKHKEETLMEPGPKKAPEPGTITATGLMTHQKDEHDIWICKDCGWKYPNARPSPKIRKNHKKHCRGRAGTVAPSTGGSSDDASDSEHHGHLEVGATESAAPLIESKDRSFSFAAIEKNLPEDVSPGISPTPIPVGETRNEVPTPQEEEPGRAQEDEAAAPKEDVAAVPKENEAATPKEDEAGAPKEDKAGAPKEENAGALQEGVAGAPEEDVAGTSQDQEAAAMEPLGNEAATPKEDKAGAPKEDEAGAPKEEKAGALQEGVAGAPEEDVAGTSQDKEAAGMEPEPRKDPEPPVAASGGLMLHQKDEHDIWICKECGWKYPNAKPSPKIRKNHKKQCPGKAGARAAAAPEGSSDEASEDEHHLPSVSAAAAIDDNGSVPMGNVPREIDLAALSEPTGPELKDGTAPEEVAQPAEALQEINGTESPSTADVLRETDQAVAEEEKQIAEGEHDIGKFEDEDLPDVEVVEDSVEYRSLTASAVDINEEHSANPKEPIEGTVEELGVEPEEVPQLQTVHDPIRPRSFKAPAAGIGEEPTAVGKEPKEEVIAELVTLPVKTEASELPPAEDPIKSRSFAPSDAGLSAEPSGAPKEPEANEEQSTMLDKSLEAPQPVAVGGLMLHQKDEKDIWICKDCGWRYPNAKPSPKIKNNHKKKCLKRDSGGPTAVGGSSDEASDNEDHIPSLAAPVSPGDSRGVNSAAAAEEPIVTSRDRDLKPGAEEISPPSAVDMSSAENGDESSIPRSFLGDADPKPVSLKEAIQKETENAPAKSLSLQEAMDKETQEEELLTKSETESAVATGGSIPQQSNKTEFWTCKHPMPKETRDAKDTTQSTIQAENSGQPGSDEIGGKSRELSFNSGVHTSNEVEAGVPVTAANKLTTPTEKEDAPKGAVVGGLMPHQKDEADIWLCKECGWRYPNAKPSSKIRKNHKKKCPGKAGATSKGKDAGSSDDASSDDEKKVGKCFPCL